MSPTHKSRSLVSATALLFTMLVGNTHAVYVDSAGNTWRLVTDTVNISYDAMAVACPTDGTTACTGSVSNGTTNVDVNGYIWATNAQVGDLFAELTSNITISGSDKPHPGGADAEGQEDNPTATNWASDAQDALGRTSTTNTSATLEGMTSTEHASLTERAYIAHILDYTVGDVGQRPDRVLNHVHLPQNNPSIFIGHWMFTPVPVPAAAWLFGSALLGMVGIRRRNQNAAR